MLSCNQAQALDSSAQRDNFLEEQIVELAAHIHAATYHLLMLIEEYDRRDAWADSGFRSCAHWLNWRIGLNLGAAREKVRTARALLTLPKISAAFSRGEISYAKVRAISRIARTENEEDLLEIAKATTASQVEKMVRLMRKGSAEDELQNEQDNYEQRSLVTYFDEDGMFVIRGKLTAEMGAYVQKALELATHDLLEEKAEEKLVQKTHEQWQADALVQVAQSALDNQLQKGLPSDRVQVVVHVEAEQLRAPEKSGLCTIENQTRVSAETCRRLSCDAKVVTVVEDAKGNPLELGRQRRVISSSLRRVLLARDQHCQYPGCTNRHYLEGHHIQHWSAGGKTDMENIALLCEVHHWAVHEGGIKFTKDKAGRLVFQRLDGKRIEAAGQLPFLAANSHLNLMQKQPWVRPENLSAWNGDRLDYDMAIAAVRR